ncbi:conserved hypothetical protein [Rhodococcus jostii RHA1]|uniref:Uncharacterized protein n=1 Tax=Rhodococcus jostii (strain RHA1) TaxID=101510 RepID=Q0SK51_RHOJR|nr:hypothetical protein [Rhodococcus jostii]ABG92085.1 conserved hypothetical protein [Rhodococcus jostii RHA1]
MIEAVTGLLARRTEPADARSDPPEHIDHDARVRGVAVGRLLAVAALTPEQAALLVADALHELELARGEGPYPFRLRNVTVSDAGHLTIECAGSASRRDMNEAVVELLRSIATNCRGSALADRLHESLAETTDLDALVHRVRQAIAPDVDPAEERRKRCQLAGLVAATTGRPRPDTEVVGERTDVRDWPYVAAGSTLAPSGWFPPVRNPWHRKRRRPSRRQGALGLIAILILVAAAWMAPRVWSELRRGWDAVLNPVNPSEQNQIRPVSPPPPEPQADQPPSATIDVGRPPPPVDIGAPGSAGPITLVTVTRANGECLPGQACAIRVDIRLDPAAAVGAVTWRVNVYDRCSGEVRPTSDVTLPVQPGSQQVYGIVRTDLPPGAALAVAAVTSAPATAASEPLLVPAENARC